KSAEKDEKRGQATLFSGATPHLLRGPEHDYAWCDELAKWEHPQESWDTLQLGLRLGTRPRALITTTPRPGAVLRTIMDDPDTVATGGSTRRNPHLPPAWKQRVERMYAGTRLGRQELDGELLPEAGALWSVELIEGCRLQIPPRDGEGDREAVEGALRAGLACGEPPPSALRAATSPCRGGFVRTLIAVDPPSGDGTCGIIACARDAGGIAHILADHSVTARSPDGWASAVADAAAIHGTSDVVAEANQGGKMVKAVLHTADPGLRVKLVTAVQGKTLRAEPVVHLFEAGKVVLHGRFPALEAELLGMIAGGKYEGPGVSPDRADAMVWGMTELMLGRRAEARITVG
ncbi:MAG: terminase family protein, partial [Pseudomonadota bacterium]